MVPTYVRSKWRQTQFSLIYNEALAVPGIRGDFSFKYKFLLTLLMLLITMLQSSILGWYQWCGIHSKTQRKIHSNFDCHHSCLSRMPHSPTSLSYLWNGPTWKSRLWTLHLLQWIRAIPCTCGHLFSNSYSPSISSHQFFNQFCHILFYGQTVQKKAQENAQKCLENTQKSTFNVMFVVTLNVCIIKVS